MSLGSLINFGGDGDDSDEDDSPSPQREINSNTNTALNIAKSTIVDTTGGQLHLVPVSKKTKDKDNEDTGGLSLLGGYTDDDDDDNDEGSGGLSSLLGGGAKAGPIDIDSNKRSSPSGPKPGGEVKEPKTESRKSSSLAATIGLLPPEPHGDADPKLQEKISRFLSADASFNFALQGKPQFHNPYILSKVARMYEIEQTGSNYPSYMYNPKDFNGDDFYESLAKEQEAEMIAASKKKQAIIAPTATAAAMGAQTAQFRGLLASGNNAQKNMTLVGKSGIQAAQQQAMAKATALKVAKAALAAQAVQQTLLTKKH